MTSGVITITTDFGHGGPFVGVMKGVILARFGEARIIDLTHEIPVHWPAEAGFWLQRSYYYFSPGTVHVAVVDPGVGTEREIIAAAVDRHIFLAPDNGLLAPLLDRATDAAVHRLDQRTLDSLALPPPSATFHGRDIFAPVAAELAAGRLTPEELGPRIDDWIPGWLDEPEAAGGRVSGVVVTVDNFGNLITNIGEEYLESFERPQILAGGRAIGLGETYGRSKPGEYLALVNSFGVLEIARAEASAAAGLGLDRGAPVRITEADDDTGSASR
jgi:S-adenosylmethionine hydrolase